MIIRAIDKLPTTLPVQQVADAEAFLVQQAQQFDASVLAGIAQRLLDTLNPDGTLTDQDWQQRHRHLSLVPTGDGMHRLTADLDSETAALATTVLHSLAAPAPSPDGDRDERSAGQRMHDAFRSVLKLALRSGQLPQSGGVPATVLISMSAEQFETRTGPGLTPASANNSRSIRHSGWPMRPPSPGSCTTATAASSTTAPPNAWPPATKPWP